MVARLLPLLVLLLLAGCLEVDSMDVTVVADLPNDRLDVMLVSRGLSSSWTGTGIERDRKDLLSCREVAAVPVPGLGVVDATATRRAGATGCSRMPAAFAAAKVDAEKNAPARAK